MDKKITEMKARYLEIEAQRATIETIWRRNGCIVKKTAAELGMAHTTLTKHLRSWGLLQVDRRKVWPNKKGLTVPRLMAAIDKGFSECTTYEGIRGYWLGLRAALGSIDADSQGS